MKWLFIVCLLLLYSCAATVNWPKPYLLPNKIKGVDNIGQKRRSAGYVNLPVGQGRVYMKHGQVLAGDIWIMPFTTYVKGHIVFHRPMVELVTKPWSEINKQNIHEPGVFEMLGLGHVDSVRMKLPLPHHLGDSTTYINYHNTDFYRLDIRKGNIAVYDFSEIDGHDVSYYTDHYNRIRRMILVHGSDTTRICSGSSSSFTKEPVIKKRIVKFIRKRYNSEKSVKDFKDAGEMLEFIVTEESKR